MKSSFTEYLKTLRNEAALSQQEVAYRGGISIDHIAKIEQGRRRPSATVLKKLATIYDVPLVCLLQAAGYWDEDPSRSRGPQDVETAFPSRDVAPASFYGLQFIFGHRDSRCIQARRQFIQHLRGEGSCHQGKRCCLL